MLNRLLLSLLLLLLVSTKPYAQGGPPMLTDDPATVEEGKWEINTGFVVEHVLHGVSIYEAPLVDVNYGVIDNLQLKFETPLVIQHTDDSTTVRAVGKSNFGIKWKFLEEEKAGIAIGIYPQLIFINSLRAVERGLVEKGTELYLPVAFQKGFGKGIWVMQLGRLLLKHDPGEWTYGLLYVHELSEVFEVAGEVNGSIKPSFEDSETFLNVGTRAKLNDMFKILLSAGRNIKVHTGEESTTIGYVGLQTFF